ncbi:unnamed protein product, partial [Mesorhabditis belari]|uniref:Trehalase n=1 Tax=Mesorhabditis belari TaxID=2138241 RepID=A0AAF3F5X8_9BILA
MLYHVVTLLCQIYCTGPLLRAVQESRLFSDSKTFVDMPLKEDPVKTLKEFAQLGPKAAADPVILAGFVNAHFRPPGQELIACRPDDWSDFPLSFLRIKNHEQRRWALHLHRTWRDLCRRVRDEVRLQPELNSLLYVPYPFIIPGGRFREFYYWDTFWIVRGLLVSEMPVTAQGVIRNLAHMVKQHGFVPNGGRVYYLTRSQPPLLAHMVYDYFLATGDIQFLIEMLDVLEKEFNFWIKHRTLTLKFGVDTHSVGDENEKNEKKEEETLEVFQYRVKQLVPRPESYREDMHLVEGVEDPAKREEIWSDIAAAAETGWDFSTRWLSHNESSRHLLKTIRTHRIIPADLNAFMCANARILASVYEITGGFSKVAAYNQRYRSLKRALEVLHWNATEGIWFDYDLDLKGHFPSYYISNAIPLWTRCFDDDDIPNRVHSYLHRTGAFNFTKGLPTSMMMLSEQQWDKENAWPPMVHMVIEGFRLTGDARLMKEAARLARVWLTASYQSFILTHAMFEKYNVSAFSDASGAGSGGEYEVQTGFGWTNGVILDLLDKFAEHNAGSPITRISIVLFVTLLWVFVRV